MPTLAGSKHLSVHLLVHMLRLFHHSTENCTGLTVGNGHQNAYFRANTVNDNINKKK